MYSSQPAFLLSPWLSSSRREEPLAGLLRERRGPNLLSRNKGLFSTKMTIAQLYNYLLTQCYFVLKPGMGVSCVQNNAVIPIASPEEAITYDRCMRLPPFILAEAHHSWALELSFARPMGELLSRERRAPGFSRAQLAPLPERSFATDACNESLLWLAERLQGYTRQHSPAVVKKVMREVLDNHQAYHMLRLEEAIEQVNSRLSQTSSSLPARMLARTPRVVQPRIILQLTNPSKDPIAGQESIHRHALLNGHSYIIVTRANGVRSTMFVRENEIPHCLLGEKITTGYHTDEDNLRKLHELLAKPLQSNEELFVGRVQARSPTGEDESCAICFDAIGDYSCGLPRCSSRFCSICFHAWFQKHEKCPHCRQGYIPIALRAC